MDLKEKARVYLDKHDIPLNNEDNLLLKQKIINIMTDFVEQQTKELKDILECIVKFDDTETLEIKGRYFDVIQKDLKNYFNE